MAFLPQGQQQQEQDQQQDQGQIPVIPSFQGSGGPSTGEGAGTGVQNTASPAGSPTSPWQNVSAYLQANAGQAGDVADTIGGNLTNQYNAANQGIQNVQKNFGQQIESARIPLNQQLAEQAATTPGQFAKDPNNVAAFQKMFNASYGGPQDFSHSQDYSALQSQIQNAQKQAALVNQGTPGLMTLLQQAESQGGRNPTQGVTALDSLLLQEDPNNFSKLSAAAKPFSGLTSYLGQTQTGLDAAAQKAAQEAAATKSQLQNQFIGQGGVAPTMQNKLNQELQGASKKATNYNQTVADTIAALNEGRPLQDTYPNYVQSNIDPSGILAALNPYGMSTGVFQNMIAMGFPTVAPNALAQYYNAPDQLKQPGLENVMTPEEFADAQALNTLLGQSAIGVPEQLGQQFKVPTDYGSFNGRGAAQGLYDSIKGYADPGGYLANLGNDQMNNAWLSDMQTLAAWLGISGPATPPPPTPVPAGPGLGEDGGPPYLQPIEPIPPTGGGGGRHFYTRAAP